MNIYDAWSDFAESGSIIAYLRYASLKNSKENFPEYYDDEEDFDIQEDDDEAFYGRTDNRGTKYW